MAAVYLHPCISWCMFANLRCQYKCHILEPLCPVQVARCHLFVCNLSDITKKLENCRSHLPNLQMKQAVWKVDLPFWSSANDFSTRILWKSHDTDDMFAGCCRQLPGSEVAPRVSGQCSRQTVKGSRRKQSSWTGPNPAVPQIEKTILFGQLEVWSTV